ncbi:hypothetical protein AVEN_68046-1 [Araneus ventricosus]|uniref:Endonuclease/exonuclease/phosphatase domain-containing protein n=1 Tax=Araneus ventricosus TaxID=182803 RepID=A0A4Y2M8K3_ARAVE|nr:hypothetical protein AVEN_68046-1 [Araneus ventricosus]
MSTSGEEDSVGSLRFKTAIKLVSWDCQGFRSHVDDLKNIVNKYQPACLGLQETYLTPEHSTKIKSYNILRKDYTFGSRASGGVALLVTQVFPYRQISINSPIQAVAVQLHVVSLLTICCIYLPPNDNIPQQEIDDLIK